MNGFDFLFERIVCPCLKTYLSTDIVQVTHMYEILISSTFQQHFKVTNTQFSVEKKSYIACLFFNKELFQKVKIRKIQFVIVEIY